MTRASPATTIATVCFAEPPKFDFEALAYDLAQVVGAENVQFHGLLPEDDMASFEIANTRISLAYRNLATAPASAVGTADIAAVLSVAVGHDGTAISPGPLFDNRYFICSGLIARFEAENAIEMMIWLEEKRAFDQRAFDTIIEAVSEPDKTQPYPRQTKAPGRIGASARDRFPALTPTDTPDETAMPRATHGALDADRTRATRRTTEAIEMDHIRDALYQDDLCHALTGRSARTASPRDRSLPHRLTIYTMNATLMLVALPVGAAVMTYCALGRESLTVAARAMALTGAGIGFGQAGAVQNLMALI